MYLGQGEVFVDYYLSAWEISIAFVSNVRCSSLINYHSETSLVIQPSNLGGNFIRPSDAFYCLHTETGIGVMLCFSEPRSACPLCMIHLDGVCETQNNFLPVLTLSLTLVYLVFSQT